VPGLALETEHDAKDEQSDTRRARDQAPPSPVDAVHRRSRTPHVSPPGVRRIGSDKPHGSPRIRALDVPAISEEADPDLLTEAANRRTLIPIGVFGVLAKHASVDLSAHGIITSALGLKLLFEELGPKGNLLVIQCHEGNIRFRKLAP